VEFEQQRHRSVKLQAIKTVSSSFLQHLQRIKGGVSKTGQSTAISQHLRATSYTGI